MWSRDHLRGSIPGVSYKPRPRTTSRGDPMLEPNDFSESSWTGPGMMEPMYPPSPPPMPSPAPLMDEPAAAPRRKAPARKKRSEEHTSELQSLAYLVCRLLLEKKNN